MNKQSGLIWLASYPKSGNTWARIFLNCLFTGSQGPLNLNYLHSGTIASSRVLVEEALGIDISELSDNEIDLLRPVAYQQLAEDQHYKVKPKANTWPEIHKVHDAYSFLANGDALFPPSATKVAVIIVRNPLDVAVSYANHNNCSIEKSVEKLCSSNHVLCASPNTIDGQLRQYLWTWNAHTESWLNARIPKLVVRYEDLKMDSLEHFTKLCIFLGLNYSREEISAAIEASAFDKVRQIEIENGFKEKAPEVKHFFRKGVVGDWRNALNDKHIKRIIQYNAPLMRRLGYIDQHNEPQTIPLPPDKNLCSNSKDMLC